QHLVTPQSAGPQHDGIDTGLPGGRGSVSERSVPNKTLLFSSPSPSDTASWAFSTLKEAPREETARNDGTPT
ncbi:hypothetical protein ABG768_010752, partial [Culter alburnus]